MIIVELKGGFGNQLFQYAAGLSLAKHHSTDLKIDITHLQKPDEVTGTFRKVDVYNLAETPLVATTEELNYYQNLPTTIKYKNKLLPFYKRKIYKEKSNKFDTNFFDAGSNLMLRGNRQSEKYFKPCARLIKEKFSLLDQIIEPVKKYADYFNKHNSVSVHIRRGDYLSAVALEWLGLLPMSYYEQAINLFKQGFPDCIFYIFSDDICWVKKNLQIKYEHVFVSTNFSKSSMEDFYLLSQCKHNIVANSTFSWWAAWLNNNVDKMIIAPRKWYNMEKLNNADLIPESWIKI